MGERMKRSEEYERIKKKLTKDNRLGRDGKYDAETGAIETPDDIPRELKTGRGKVICTDTAEGVVGDVSDPEKDPMRIDKKY